MAIPEADNEAMLQRAIAVLESHYLYFITGSTEFDSFATHDADLVAGVSGDFANAILNVETALRNALSNPLTQAQVLSYLQPYIDNYREILDLPVGSSNTAVFDALYQHYIDGSKTITERDLTYGAVTADSGNVGDGVIYRLHTDKEGYELQYAYPDVKTLTCIRAANSGAQRHQEVFQLQGGSAETANLMKSDPRGTTVLLTGLIAGAGATIIPNSSFTSQTGSGATLDIANWEATSDIENFATSSDFYRDIRESSAKSVEIVDNDTLSTDLTGTAQNATQFNPSTPYFVQVAFKTVGLCNGTLTLSLGNASVSRALTGLSGWDTLVLHQAAGAAAQGTLTLDTEPADGDTMTIGSTVYRFKTSIAQAQDILRGDGLAAVKTRLVNVLNGTGGTSGVDYYAGTTTPHATVKVANSFSGNNLILTARLQGVAGDSIATTETFTAGTNVFDATTLGAVTAGAAVTYNDDSWYENFKTSDLSLSITLSGQSTGSVIVDDVICQPYTLFENQWYAALGGLDRWQLDDFYTITDTQDADTGTICKYLGWAFNRTLPTASSGSVVDPDLTA